MRPVARQGDTLLVRVEQPHLVTARVLAALGDAAARLSALRVVRPSLDNVFLRLTGGQHGGDGEDHANTHGIEAEQHA